MCVCVYVNMHMCIYMEWLTYYCTSQYPRFWYFLARAVSAQTTRTFLSRLRSFPARPTVNPFPCAQRIGSNQNLLQVHGLNRSCWSCPRVSDGRRLAF